MAQWRVGAARDLPILQSERGWDGARAKKEIFAWAGWPDNPNPAKARKCFLVYDAENDENKGAYKLPFCYIVDGQPKAVPSGLRAAASRLPQADLPQDVKDRARAVLDAYFRRLNKSMLKAVTTDTGLVLEGYAVIFGGEDLEGEYFTQETRFLLEETQPDRIPVTWDHNGTAGVIGWVESWRIDDRGVWVRIRVEDPAVQEEVRRAVENGELGLSTGSAPHMVARVGRWIAQWPIVEVALTERPAEPRTIDELRLAKSDIYEPVLTAYKSALQNAEGGGGTAEGAAPNADGEAGSAQKNEEPKEEGTSMEKLEALQKEIDALKATLEGFQGTAEELKGLREKVENLEKQKGELEEAVKALKKRNGPEIMIPSDPLEVAPVSTALLKMVRKEVDRVVYVPDGDPLRLDRAMKRYGGDKRTLVIGPSKYMKSITGGSNLKPTGHASQLYAEAIYDASLPRKAGVQVFRMPQDTVNIPKGSTVTVYWGAAGSTITESAFTFTQEQLVAQSLKGWTSVDRELLQDADPAVDQLIERNFALAFGAEEAIKFLRGSGHASNEPESVQTQGTAYTLAGDTGNGAAITYADLTAMIRTLEENMGGQILNPVWVMHPKVWDKIVNLVDANNRPLFIDPLGTWGREKRLFGYPVYLVNSIPTNLTKGTGTNLSEIYLVDVGHAIMGVRQEIVFLSADVVESFSVKIGAMERVDFAFPYAGAAIYANGVQTT